MITTTKMRKGLDFQKDKDVGGICQTLANERKIPMCLLFLVFPTTFIKKDCWWLRQLIVLGVGWQDFQSSTSRTLHHG